MAVLNNLEPNSVFHYFEEICRIPHGSGNVEKISHYLADFARERQLEYKQDSFYNIVIVKKAAAGYEKVEPLILQGHMDMVAVRKPDSSIDMEAEGLHLEVAGDEIYAEGTSLGGDDGIAVAYALALLDSDQIAHPRLEVVLTVDEETGMEGANGIDLSWLQGRQMLNLDSEEEGTFLAGCAGGARVKVHLPVQWEEQEGGGFRIMVKGLKGGHSGCEIEKERGNANCLLARLLVRLSERMQVRIVSLEGGLADNAIPREAEAVLLVKAGEEELLQNCLTEYEKVLQHEYAVKDPEVCVTGESLNSGSFPVLTEDSGDRLTKLLFEQPNGVQAMSADFPGLVQTSLNLGIVRLTQKGLFLDTSVRSSVSSEKKVLIKRLQLLAGMFGASVEVQGEYPAWEYRQDSPLRRKMLEVYKRMYGREAKVAVIHAGLECGILSGKIPNLDCVAIGPDMKNIHTTEERLSISSVRRVWEYILEVLAEK